VQQALATAQSSARGLALDPESLNPHFSYVDAAKRTHRVWLLDAVTAHNQIRAAESRGVVGTALWRLGSEDPTFWSLWRHAADHDVTLRSTCRTFRRLTAPS
jgi:spore germination protein YaaH